MLLIKNATIYTMAQDVIEKGDILVKDGKIAKIGVGLEEPEAEILNAEGLVALPGMIDTHTHIGGFDPLVADNMDLNEMTDPATPQMQAIHGVDISDKNFQFAHKAGVTTVCIAPGSGNVIGGWAFATKTFGTNIFEMAIKNPCALKMALGGNPKGVYGPKMQAPMTRMGIASIMRNALRTAKEYMEKKEAAGDDQSKLPPYDAKSEAIIPALKGEIPLKIHSEQFDMVTAIDIAKEFGCWYSIDHAWAAYDFFDELVEGGGTIMFGPSGVPNGYGELTGADIFCVKELDKRGLNVTLITDSPIYSLDMLLVFAGEAVRWGTPHERALRMITINAAKALGIEDRVGSLEVGKDADIVLFKGVPALDTNAKVQYTIMDGKVIYTHSN
jgi:imidazolonepropionase-like amidohydrolase